jgi:hypothetical protein
MLIAFDGGLEMLGIGLVTAVAQAGTEADGGVGESVGALGLAVGEPAGRVGGLILAEAGFSGRGGKLMRSVSRFGPFGSAPDVPVSAIIVLFYSYFCKCSMAKFAMVTYLSI